MLLSYHDEHEHYYYYSRTVGDNEVVGLVPLYLDWEVMGGMVASVDQYEAFRALKRKEDFILGSEERVSVLETCDVTASVMFQMERERLDRLEEEWTSLHLEEKWNARFRQSIRVPREYGRASRHPVALGRQSDAACLSKAPSKT
jgi:hypothetical protein